MTETDLKAHAADLRSMNASSDYRTFRKAADAMDAAAARLEAQSRALTASQEVIDTLQERITALEAKLADCAEALGTALDEMADYADTHPAYEEISSARSAALDSTPPR